MTVIDFKRINLGHILTIITLIGSLVVFSMRIEGRLVKIETHVEWLIKLHGMPVVAGGVIADGK
jgi:hypothetical protein